MQGQGLLCAMGRMARMDTVQVSCLALRIWYLFNFTTLDECTARDSQLSF